MSLERPRQVRFSKAQCRALRATFGSWDWDNRPSGTWSGDAHYRAVYAFLKHGSRKNGFGNCYDHPEMSWPTSTVQLLLSLIRATVAKPDHSHGCKTQYRKWPPRHVREALARRIAEVQLVTGYSVVDMLGELVQ